MSMFPHHYWISHARIAGCMWYQRIDHVLEQRALQMINNHEGMANQVTLREELKTPLQGKELAERMVGDAETDIKRYYELPPGETGKDKETRPAGIYDQFRALGALDYITGTGFAIYNPVIDNPAWTKSIDKVIMERMPNYMTPETLIKFRQEYTQQVEAVIAQLGPEERAQSSLVEAAVQSDATLKVFAEAYLDGVRDKMISTVADEFMKTEKVQPTQTAIAMILPMIQNRFAATVQEYYFARNSFVQTWNERAVHDHIVSDSALQLAKDRRDMLWQQKEEYQKGFEQHKQKHTQEEREKDAELKKEYGELRKKSEDTIKHYEESKKEVEHIEDIRKHATEREKDFEKRHTTLENKVIKKEKK